VDNICHIDHDHRNNLELDVHTHIHQMWAEYAGMTNKNQKVSYKEEVDVLVIPYNSLQSKEDIQGITLIS
jgi:hypothetical protein